MSRNPRPRTGASWCLGLACGGLALVLGCKPAEQAPATPGPAATLLVDPTTLPYRKREYVALPSLARLWTDPDDPEAWFLADDPKLSPARQEFFGYRVVGYDGDWVVVEPHAADDVPCPSPWQLAGVQVKLRARASEATPMRHFEGRTCPQSDGPYLGRESGLELRGYGYALVGQVAVTGQRLVTVPGCRSCVVDRHTERVPIRSRIAEPELSTPAGVVVGLATRDFVARDLQVAGDGRRACFSVEDGDVYPRGQSVRLCADSGWLRYVETRDRGYNERPSFSRPRVTSATPEPEFPQPVRLSYPAVATVLRRASDEVLGCVPPESFRHASMKLRIDEQGRAAVERAYPDESRPCLEQAFASIRWPAGHAVTHVDLAVGAFYPDPDPDPDPAED